MKIVSMQEINARIRLDPQAFVRQVDAEFADLIRVMAEDIQSHAEERPIILLSGPSGSGKTSSARMLEMFLDQAGCETHTLSMDNYFSPFTPEELELVSQGKIDLESPDRLDITFLNEQLSDILACRPVELPKYDFVESKRVPLGQTLTRKPGELVLLEGIHALNPDVISIPEETTSRLYVSVRTRIDLGENLLLPRQMRLLRRMLRDKRGRARSFAETLEMFDKVEAGETKYIMPYKPRATHELDTFHAYEIAVYRTMIEQHLSELNDIDRLSDLKLLMDLAEPLNEDIVPQASLIREFIGNSLFTD